MAVGRTPIGKQVPVALPPELKERADAEALRRGISLAKLMRLALERELDQTGERGPVEIASQAAVEALRAEGWHLNRTEGDQVNKSGSSQ